MRREDVIANGAGLEDADVAVLQHGYAAQRVPRAVLVGLEVLGVKVHPVQFVVQAQFLQQPQRAAGA